MSRDFRAEVEALRPYLLRYASLQLRNADAAEDAVQETLLAALAAEASYAGRASAQSLTKPTGTQAEQYAIAAREFGSELSKLKQLADVELPALEN